MATKIKIKKGDTVRVIAGSEKGSEGTVVSIFREKNKVIVEGVNLIKKAQQTQCAKSSRRNNRKGSTYSHFKSISTYIRW